MRTQRIWSAPRSWPRRIAWAVVVSCAVLAVTPVEAKDKKKPLAQYEAFAQSTAGLTQGRAGMLEFAVSRWTTDEERASLIETLAQDDSRALARAMQRQDVTGWVRLPDSLRFNLRYARRFELDGGGERIVMAVDRPIGSQEAIRGTQHSLDFSLSLIVLEVDAKGKGSGIMMIGAKLALNQETNTLEIIDRTTSPITLNEVRRRRPK